LDHGEYDRVSLIEAEIFEDFLDFLRVDGAGFVVIEEVEGFLIREWRHAVP
jgi:hypothetical protein